MIFNRSYLFTVLAPFFSTTTISHNHIMDQNPQPQPQPKTPDGTADSLAIALLPSLPLLMHSAGDALPEEVSPESTAVLSTLIEQYISSLVSAAMDAHDVFTDGEVVGGGAALNIPSFLDKRESVNKKDRTGPGKKRKIDYWDEPLTNSDDDISSDDDAPLSASRRRSSLNSNSSVNETPTSGTAALLDIHTSRTRKYYVTAPTAMDVRSFIFPICHDAVLYQRIKELQSNRRQIRRDLTERTLIQMVREEGDELIRGVGVDAWEAVWGARAPGEGAASGALIKAGLVDGDGVDSTWPGLDVLKRESPW